MGERAGSMGKNVVFLPKAFFPMDDFVPGQVGRFSIDSRNIWILYYKTHE